MGHGWAAVVSQRAEDARQGGGVNAVAGGGDVAAAGAEAAERLCVALPAVADQVEGGGDGATEVDDFLPVCGSGIAGDQTALQRERATVDDAAAASGGVAADGAVGQGCRAAKVAWQISTPQRWRYISNTRSACASLSTGQSLNNTHDSRSVSSKRTSSNHTGLLTCYPRPLCGHSWHS